MGVNTSSTSLRVSWQTPPFDDQNGDIVGYNVSYGLATQGRSLYIDQFTNVPMIELTSLNKFALYEVAVSAFTVAIGPEDTVQVMTDSDCKFPSQIQHYTTI